MTDIDIKITIENMPFFMESLVQRFEYEGCPVLPTLCRAVATEIERLQTRQKLLEKGVIHLIVYDNGMIRCRVCGHTTHKGQEIPHDDDCILIALKE